MSRTFSAQVGYFRALCFRAKHYFLFKSYTAYESFNFSGLHSSSFLIEMEPSVRKFGNPCNLNVKLSIDNGVAFRHVEMIGLLLLQYVGDLNVADSVLPLF